MRLCAPMVSVYFDKFVGQRPLFFFLFRNKLFINLCLAGGARHICCSYAHQGIEGPPILRWKVQSGKLSHVKWSNLGQGTVDDDSGLRYFPCTAVQGLPPIRGNKKTMELFARPPERARKPLKARTGLGSPFKEFSLCSVCTCPQRAGGSITKSDSALTGYLI